MKNLTFDWIRRSDGTSEFIAFMNTLPQKDQAKLYAIISLTEEHGIEIAKKMKWTKKLRDGICELRSKQGSDTQRVLYFHNQGEEYIITHGFTKKTDVVPAQEIERSRRMRDEYLKDEENE
ncbi:MAG: type II toxin-antitoxin system RelE/ParE family toxin [Coriobacteriales bacterium]|jgi:phage-related protein|nr:type II toxin-antitoxin system RelE/ParE family toxin [Coriobacteriales bacterium]